MNGSISSGETEADRTTGIEGIVTVSPTRPGPIKKGAEAPSAAPLPNAAFSVANDKGQVTSFTTDGDGRFRLSLAPGHYSVSLAEYRFPRPCGPFEIDVVSGKMTEVEWRCDTGMR
jgi:Prealbumin-like fold domain